ncbi:MAG TPA: tRNA preQ1(34) S-adenosylmethionine ribosyltransferase-isomerase QueA [Candidatus Binatia bacterium]|jgi:S-adenosylmethionine:tRNA ribosyltransferase-isomerase|nr:tRNA preQ1(34) S-adenosylmethionine ribosyltransferase-isomerase QueA [Candidatus Binatia bacterium]
MLLSDFDYDLPSDLIAQEPVPERTSSRLLVVERRSGRLSHYHFSDLQHLLPPDCLLVLNDTRVFPARLRGRKESSGAVEVLLLHRVAREEETWEVLCKGAQGMRTGSRLWFAPELSAEWCSTPREGRGVLRLFAQGELSVLLERLGEIPLPPYIKRPVGGRAQDRDRYQTVYAHHPGAVAAPTAGLHFTEELLAALRQRGIETVFVTLHVGAGTFQPIRVEQVERHRMEEEDDELSKAAAERINTAKAASRKIIAVGTTTTRALESACTPEGKVQMGRHRTSLFIYPGYRFSVIDGLITNFHLPRSTLLLLVSAFAGRELTLKAYAEAVARRYRFYSYGDAMLIV